MLMNVIIVVITTVMHSPLVSTHLEISYASAIQDSQGMVQMDSVKVCYASISG